jgi:CheY-like chemotaxis protein
MNELPRVLVIDDDFGRILKRSENGVDIEENQDRTAFCVRTGLQDVTGDIPAEQIADPVAEAVFLSGLASRNGALEWDVEGTLVAIRRGWEKWPRWALILLDLHFKTGEMKPDGVPVGRPEDRDPPHYYGLELLDHLKKDTFLRDIPVVVLSAMERERIEPRIAKFANGFIDKSKLAFDKSRIPREKGKCEDWMLTEDMLETFGLLDDDKIIGHSVALLKCLRDARVRARECCDNILVLGESGTGKKLIAEYIHVCSARPGQFVPLFIHGEPESWIDDRLFGHEAVAFPSARGSVPGAAELADGGTLFIDEFRDIPPSIQTKLLRLLDKKTLNLQIVLATSRTDLLFGESFRNDLLARVSDPVVVPPLHERTEDIPLLVQHFLNKYEKEFKAEPRR